MARPKDHADYGERVLTFAPPSKGRDVWDLQTKLIGWGSGSDSAGIGAPFMPVRVTGTFDAATRDAVKRFQQALALPLTGIADAATFRAIDREAGLYPVLVHPMRCPCVDDVAPPPGKKNDGPIPCRCTDHHKKGACTGFGHGQFAGKFLLDGAKQFDGTSLSSEKLDVYDKQEYPGVDKALLWAVRALMRRANVDRIAVTAGYRCWHDNYHRTDARRWRHRQSTFHFGKSVEFYHDGTCAEYGQNATAARCNTCNTIRTRALELCGFQPRWQEPDRVSVAEVERDVAAPSNPFAVHVSTVRRRDREKDEFVKTFAESVRPVFSGRSYSLPIDLAGGLDWRTAPTAPFYFNTETGPGGWYPFGPNRIWHTGIHLFAPAATAVHAIADGEVVACRAGEADNLHALGSRNFVLLRHKTKKDKVWYSLYTHLDAEVPAVNSVTPWRQKLHVLTTAHVEMSLPCPLFSVAANHLVPEPGLGPGEWSATAVGQAALDPRVAGGPLDAAAPENSSVIQVAIPANRYVFLKLEDEELGKFVAADATLQADINAHNPLGLPNPIPVAAGETLGSIATAPTHASLAPHQTFLHMEVFSEEQILAGKGYLSLAAADATKVLDRKAVMEALRAKDMVMDAPEDVVLESDLNLPGSGVDRVACRNVILKTVSAWKLDWDAALKASTTYGFMADAPKNALGTLMNRYRWWDTVHAAAGLPAAAQVFHYHPITVLLQLASEG